MLMDFNFVVEGKKYYPFYLGIVMVKNGVISYMQDFSFTKEHSVMSIEKMQKRGIYDYVKNLMIMPKF